MENSGPRTWKDKASWENGAVLEDPSLAASQNSLDESRMSKMVSNHVKCLQERERGSGIHYLMAPFHSLKTGGRHRWKSFMEGEGPAILNYISFCFLCNFWISFVF